MTTPEIKTGALVNWLDCPKSVDMFQPFEIKEICEQCGKAWLFWIFHPVNIKRLEIFDPIKDAVRSVREGISYQTWGAIAKLTESWAPEFKQEVWRLLTPEEKKAINQLKVNG